MLVYRIEHKTRKNKDSKWYKGPFGCRYDYPDHIADAMSAPPGPRDWWYEDHSMVFACPCVDSFLDWFNEDIQLELRKHGYMVSVYDAEEYIVSPYGEQVVFYPESARKIRRFTFKHYKDAYKKLMRIANDFSKITPSVPRAA